MNNTKNTNHSGHRRRMLDKFEKYGHSVFTDHELLEIILFFPIPRRNTNVTAHRLLDEFGSLEGVLNADARKLITIDGVGKSTTLFFRIISAFLHRCEFASQKDVKRFNSVSTVCEFLRSQLQSEPEEHFCAMFLDNSMRLIKFAVLSDGNVSSSTADAQKVARMAVLEGASSVIIAHNHPGGSALPSAADRHITRMVDSTLSAVSVSLIEHIIVGEDSVIPTMVSDFSPAPSAFGHSKPDDAFYKKFYSL